MQRLFASATECSSRRPIPSPFVADEIGTYALVINANDLATMGATPKWFLATLLLPVRATTTSVNTLFVQLHAICRCLHVSLCGGHSEVIDAVTRPVVVGCLLGECAPNRIVKSAGARVGVPVHWTTGLPMEAYGTHSPFGVHPQA
jgi:hydrogenase maturation factor